MFLWGRDDKAYQQAYQDVYAEDYQTNCTIVLKYLNVTKFSLEDDNAFEKRFLSNLHFLEIKIPRVSQICLRIPAKVLLVYVQGFVYVWVIGRDYVV